jgi:hypothetical protein
MTQEQDEIDARLASLAERTAGVRPRAGFSARVMADIAREPQPVLLSLQRPAWRFFPAGLLAAALALVWAVSASNAVNEELAVGYDDDVELDW